MKKRYFLCSFIMVIFLSVCSACSRNAENTVVLPIEDLKDADTGDFQWPEIPFGLTIEETEKAFDCKIPECPWGSDYLERVNGQTEPAIDYRTDTSYRWADFLVYKNGKPVLVTYGEACGYLVFTFQEGKLGACYVSFGDQPMGNDEKMDYGGTKNDPQRIYEQLQKDLTEFYGETEEGYRNADTGEWQKQWYAKKRDNYYTRMYPMYFQDEYYSETKLIIQRTSADLVEATR